MSFRVYNKDGNILLDAEQSVFSLVKSSRLTRQLDRPFSHNKNRIRIRNKRLLINSRHEWREADIHTPEYCMYYIDVPNAISPIAAVRYEGDSSDCNPIYLLNTSFISDNTARLMFYSNGRLTDGQLSRYQVYIFDVEALKENHVGMNLYDRQGNITFSSRSRPLNVIDEYKEEPSLESKEAYLRDAFVTLTQNPRVTELFRSYLEGLRERLESSGDVDWRDTSEYVQRMLVMTAREYMNQYIHAYGLAKTIKKGTSKAYAGLTVPTECRYAMIDLSQDLFRLNRENTLLYVRYVRQLPQHLFGSPDTPVELLKVRKGLFHTERMNVITIGTTDGVLVHEVMPMRSTNGARLEREMINSQIVIEFFEVYQHYRYIDVSNLPFPYN